MTFPEALPYFLAGLGGLCLAIVLGAAIVLLLTGREIEEDEPPRPVSWDPAQGGVQPPEVEAAALKILGHKTRADLDESNRLFAEKDGRNAEYGHGIGVTLGDEIGGFRRGISRWFNAEPNVVDGRWLCPKDDCDGEMLYTGWSWPMSNPGNHHECTTCDLVAAITDHQYPEAP